MAAADGVSAALVRRPTTCVLEVGGRDARDYLQRMLTQDLRGLAPGRAAYACLLNVKGRVLGDLLVWDCGPHLLLEMDEAARPAVLPVLERHVIADDVSLRDVGAEHARCVLFGDGAVAALEREGCEHPPQGSFVGVEVDGRAARLLRFDRRGLVSFEWDLPPESLAALEERLALPGDPALLEAACVAHAIPRFGHELHDAVLLNEAGLEEAVSWRKGCYPGQEPVVMARHRGRPPRRLVRLALAEGRLPAPGAGVHHEGVVVGQVTSAAAGPGGRVLALAFVKHALAEEGAHFTLDGGVPAVAHLPGTEAP